jgi:group I intron endonuclease
MVRPIGVLGKKRVSLDYQQIRLLIEDYKTMSNPEILEKYNISRQQLRDIRRDYKLVSKEISHLIKKQNRVKMHHNDILCGVYGIYRNDGRKIYIGSSVDIRSRIKRHISQLESNSHYNLQMQKDYADNEWSFFVIELCEEKDLLEKENAIICSLHDAVVYNKTKHTNIDANYDAIYESIKHRIEISEDGCWNWTGRKKKGYGVIERYGSWFFSHRVFYMAHHKEYPFLVHHKCNNKLCCNPEHLEGASHAKNAQEYVLNQRLTEESILHPFKDYIVECRDIGIPYHKIKEQIGVDVEISTIKRFYERCTEGRNCVGEV